MRNWDLLEELLEESGPDDPDGEYTDEAWMERGVVIAELRDRLGAWLKK